MTRRSLLSLLAAAPVAAKAQYRPLVLREAVPMAEFVAVANRAIPWTISDSMGFANSRNRESLRAMLFDNLPTATTTYSYRKEQRNG